VRINARRVEKIRVQGEEVEEFDEFVYLGVKVSKDDGGTEDIKNRLRKARGAFQNLTKIWNTRSIGKKTKINLFKTLVRSVLLCGCETWKMTKCEEKKLDAFQSKCLRRVLRIRWPTRVSNKEIMDRASVSRINDKITRRRWTWIKHVLCGDKSSDCMVALGWQPAGKRAVGRPKTTWRWTVEAERRKAGWRGWGTARAAAKDSEVWRENVTVLCACWLDEQ